MFSELQKFENSFINFINDEALKISGLVKEELVGKSAAEKISTTSPVRLIPSAIASAICFVFPDALQ